MASNNTVAILTSSKTSMEQIFGKEAPWGATQVSVCREACAATGMPMQPRMQLAWMPPIETGWRAVTDTFVHTCMHDLDFTGQFQWLALGGAHAVWVNEGTHKKYKKTPSRTNYSNLFPLLTRPSAPLLHGRGAVHLHPGMKVEAGENGEKAHAVYKRRTHQEAAATTRLPCAPAVQQRRLRIRPSEAWEVERQALSFAFMLRLNELIDKRQNLKLLLVFDVWIHCT